MYQSADVQTVAAILLFIWPLVFQLLSLRFPALGRSGVVVVIEFLLTCLTIAAVVSLVAWLNQFGAKLRYGSYVAIFAVAVYGLITPTSLTFARKRSAPA